MNMKINQKSQKKIQVIIDVCKCYHVHVILKSKSGYFKELNIIKTCQNKLTSRINTQYGTVFRTKGEIPNINQKTTIEEIY